MCILHIMLDLLDRLLAPLARLLVARAVPFPDFAEGMKRHYVQAARKLAEAEAQKVTDSRLSVMTGLQRRDIARLREVPKVDTRPNPLARLVALWQTDPTYCEAGDAQPLARSGEGPTFEALARQVRRDVHPRTMLDRLLAAGTVRIEGETVVLAETSYQPLPGTDDQLAYLAENAGDHLSAATDNVLGRDPRHFERALHYSGLDAEQVATLEAEYRTAQMDLLKKLSRKAARMQKHGHGALRFRAGGYFLTAKGEQQ